MSTWYEENRDPSRPLKGWQTQMLVNMTRALSMMSAMNTSEENERLAEGKRELSIRRREGKRVHRNPSSRRSWSDKRTVEHYRRKFDYTKRPTGDKIGIHENADAYLARIKRKYGVKSNPMRWSLYGGMENVGYSVLGRPIDKRSTAEAKAKAWSKLAHYPVEVKSGRKVICVYVKGRKVRSNPIPAAVWAGIEAAPYVYAAGEATYHAGRAGLAAYRKYRASHKKRSRR